MVEDLTQGEFAERLGVKGGYISTLETHRNEPSEQLILNICRAFGASYEWLKEGRGDSVYEISHRLSARGRTIVEEINKVIESPDRIWAITELAQLLGIDPDDPSKRLNFPSDFREAVLMVMRVFREGNGRKIKAVMSQLLAFMPEIDLEDLKRKVKEEHDKLVSERH